MSDKKESNLQSIVAVKSKNTNNALVEFKQPETKKVKPKILSEEKYVEEMAKIIQRDFFPDLEKLKAQNAYIDAMDRKDYAQMEALRAKYSGQNHLTNPRQMTPNTFETPCSNSVSQTLNIFTTFSKADSISDTQSIFNESEKASTTSITSQHSLDSFLHKYTSEDNHSFQEIIDNAAEKLKQKYSILYNEEKVSAEKLARVLQLPSMAEQLEARNNSSKTIETWKYQNRNSIMYVPDGAELTDEERINIVNRKQTIQHDATRFSKYPFEEMLNVTPKRNQNNNILAKTNGKVGPDGKPLNGNTQHNLDNFRGFHLIKTPSPRPGEAFSPLMTWGEIDGTPFRLDASNTPVCSVGGSSFRINATPRRESIALELAEKIGVKMRAEKQRAKDAARRNISSPFIRSNIQRLASMSPAARHLATNKLGLCSPLYRSSTPSPMQSLTLAKTNMMIMHKTTPNTKPISSRIEVAPNISRAIIDDNSTLTDDLLKIPTKRLRASDFF